MRTNVWQGTSARVESLSLELIRLDNECEILLQSSVRGTVGGRNADPPGAAQTAPNMLLWIYWLGLMRGGGELRHRLSGFSKHKSSPCSANLEEEWNSCCTSVSSLCWQETLSPTALWYLLSMAVFRKLNRFHWCSTAQSGFVLWSWVRWWVRCPVNISLALFYEGGSLSLHRFAETTWEEERHLNTTLLC